MCVLHVHDSFCRIFLKYTDNRKYGGNRSVYPVEDMLSFLPEYGRRKHDTENTCKETKEDSEI